ncbi:MAG: hypothetical protein QW228_09480 [Candidatus Aenigmatarchaeota archaeon]
MRWNIWEKLNWLADGLWVEEAVLTYIVFLIEVGGEKVWLN